MKKRMTKVMALVLVFALVAGIGITTRDSAAKKNKTDPVKKIKIENIDDFDEMIIGDEITIKADVVFSTKATAAQKKKGKKLKYSVDHKKVVSVDNNGKVTATGIGEAKITVKSKVKSKAKAVIEVSVTTKYDMVFKYSNLYFVGPEGTPFPVTVQQGGQDANNSTFDIKTLEFDGKLSDFNFTSESASVATINGDDGTLVLNGYGQTEIEAEYKQESDVGDTVCVYVLTQADFDAKKAEGEITEEKENTFEEEPDEPDDSNEPDEPDDSGDGSGSDSVW